VWTFCDRNASLCEQGRGAWKAFAAKAQFGAQLVLDLANQRLGAAQPRQSASLEPAVPYPSRAARQSAQQPGRAALRQEQTLTDADLTPVWQKPGGRPGI